MKEKYPGLVAEKISFAGQFTTTSSSTNCPPIYMTHTVTEDVTICEEAQQGEQPSTGSWTVKYNYWGDD